MRITEIAKQIGATPDEIRYFEKKGYVQSRWMRLNTRCVRDYSDSEVRKIELLVKYRRQGFEHEVAHNKATQEIEQPRLV